MEKTAEISPCGKYRYYLSRRWQEGKPTATFIMLNPSTADAEQDDPTIRRCIGFAKAWGCGRLQVINLFALRATSPKEIKLSSDPVGPDNDVWFNRAYDDASYPDDKGPVVSAWARENKLLSQRGNVDQMYQGTKKISKTVAAKMHFYREWVKRKPK